MSQLRVMFSAHAGRWRAGSVAVKIINHDRNVGNNFDAMRESVLCSNINHPNVVMTYKVRPALASTKAAPRPPARQRQCMSCMPGM